MIGDRVHTEQNRGTQKSVKSLSAVISEPFSDEKSAVAIWRLLETESRSTKQ
jgi:hypothetical protein